MTLQSTMDRGWGRLRRGAAGIGALALRLFATAAGLLFVLGAMLLGLALGGAVLLWALLRRPPLGPRAGAPRGAAWQRFGAGPGRRVREEPGAREVVDVEARVLAPTGSRGD